MSNHSQRKDKVETIMNINWKLRYKNKATLTAILATVVLLAQQLGLKLPDNISEVFNTVLTLLVLLGIINDPTTAGIEDSVQALTYSVPKDDRK